ncbi:hypothetical protein BCR44DRAFT_1440411, partial [Catenaria anguillulae PL171]
MHSYRICPCPLFLLPLSPTSPFPPCLSLLSFLMLPSLTLFRHLHISVSRGWVVALQSRRFRRIPIRWLDGNVHFY